MSVNYVQGAPRLIEWTGERCVPWADDPPVIYEHFHRYLFAASLVAGRRVLDLASGEGFGAAMLAQHAETVLGVDIDAPSIAHARANYTAPGLDFQVADALALEEFEAGSFDAVVAFEMLEHIADHQRVLAGIRHVLAPGGLIILSTPERVAYSDARDFHNPYHVHELTLPEFRDLLAGAFADVQMWGQRTVTGSKLTRLPIELDAQSGQEFTIAWREDRWELVDEAAPMFVIGVASDTPLPIGPDLSVLSDPEHGLLRHAQAGRERAEELQSGAERYVEEVKRDHERLRAELLAVGDKLADEQRRGVELEARHAEAEDLIARIQEELAVAQQFRAGVESSQVWQLFQRSRRSTYGALGGRDSRLGGLLQRCIRIIARGLLRRAR